MKKAILLFAFAAFSLIGKINAQSFFQIDSIQLVELYFHQSNWDYLLDTAKQGTEETYLIADSVRVNGTVFDSVGVKYKGNSSYNANNAKNPMHIELNTIHKKADYKGNADIKLGNGFADPSFVREPLSYEITRKYMDAPRSNFARVFINGVYYGLYSNSESINSDFLDELNWPDDNTVVKCNPKNAGPGGSTSNLGWLTADSTKYFNNYEIKSTYGWKELVQFIDTLNNKPAAIEQITDIDKDLWMHALNNVMINGDSYTGSFSQNYYLYKDGNQRFAPVMWDFNMSFGSFPLGGNGPGGVSLTVMQQLTPLYQETATNRPLISKLLATPMWKRMYMAHLRTITEENFVSKEYETRAMAMQSTISAAVAADTKKFYTTTQFTNSLDQTATGGFGNGVVGIRQLMGGRVTFLQSNAEYKKVPPALETPVVSNANPALGSTVTVTAVAPGASFVRLGFRAKHPLKFTYVEMKDDGQHGDGAAADGNFGAEMPVDGSLNEYFVYAENADAGIFSPRRAEYEFHELAAQAPQLLPGDVVINEFMATNSSTIKDPSGSFSDWVELYNNSSQPRDLSGVFLSDDWAKPKKWAVPTNTVIAPHSFVLIWANGGNTSAGLNAGFKLSGAGEQLALTTADGSVRLDSIEFTQQSADVSWGRCPNGTGGFAAQSFATPGTVNCVVSTDEPAGEKGKLALSPNPAFDFVAIRTGLERPVGVRVFNAVGQVVFQKTNLFDGERLEIGGWPIGLYFIKTEVGAAVFLKE